MRVALIAVGEGGAAPWPEIAGRPLLLRQFDFARACGVERVIAYGNGAPEDAEALRNAAARAKIAFAAIASAHALVALVDWADELIVLQPGLVPEAASAIDAIREGERVLSFSAGAVRGGGLERIDAANMWSGALVLSGALVDRLEQLGDDADPHAALLRIALQAHLPLHQLPAAAMVDGSWTRTRPGADEAALNTARVRRLAGPGVARQPSRWAADWALARFSLPLTQRRFTVAAGVAVALILLGAGLVAGRNGWIAPAFVAIALAVPVLHLARLLERVRRAAFQPSRLPRWLGTLPDAALLIAGTLGIDGALHRQLFPPLVMLIALRLMPPVGQWRAAIADRALAALAIALAALGGAQEIAIMAWALLALAAGFATPEPGRLGR